MNEPCLYVIERIGMTGTAYLSWNSMTATYSEWTPNLYCAATFWNLANARWRVLRMNDPTVRIRKLVLEPLDAPANNEDSDKGENP